MAGVLMLDQLKVMRELVGDECYERALAQLPDDDSELWRELLAIQWVPASAANRLITGVAAEAGRNVDDFANEVATIGVERTFHSLWRVLLRVTTDAALVKRTPLLYSKTYDRGQLTSKIEQPGKAELELEGWPHVPKMDLIGLAAGIRTVLACAGRKDPEVRWRRNSQGASFVATWTK